MITKLTVFKEVHNSWDANDKRKAGEAWGLLCLDISEPESVLEKRHFQHWVTLSRTTRKRLNPPSFRCGVRSSDFDFRHSDFVKLRPPVKTGWRLSVRIFRVFRG